MIRLVCLNMLLKRKLKVELPFNSGIKLLFQLLKLTKNSVFSCIRGVCINMYKHKPSGLCLNVGTFQNLEKHLCANLY